MTDDQPTIHLDQFLKAHGLVGTGGQAKLLIQDGQILLNGKVETRRRRQLHQGDVVQFEDQQLTVDFE
jgi:ribosome-associated protein